MPTATLHLTGAGAPYSGPWRCYRMDPPPRFDGRDYEFVTVVIQPRFKNQTAAVKVYPAREDGSCATSQMQRRVGSFELKDDYDPGNEAYVDGAHKWALGSLGGYEVAQ